MQARAEPKKQEKLQRQSRYIAGLLGAHTAVGYGNAVSGQHCRAYSSHATNQRSSHPKAARVLCLCIACCAASNVELLAPATVTGALPPGLCTWF